MTTKAVEKIIDAMNQLLEGYSELQELLEEDLGTEKEAAEEGELSSEVDAALVSELRTALESLVESEDYSTEELASVVSALTDALQEMDPDVFESGEEEDDDFDDDDDDDEDDEDDEEYDEDDEDDSDDK